VAMDVVQPGESVNGALVCGPVAPDFKDQYASIGVAFASCACG
jgi:hypothetical protein